MGFRLAFGHAQIKASKTKSRRKGAATLGMSENFRGLTLRPPNHRIPICRELDFLTRGIAMALILYEALALIPAGIAAEYDSNRLGLDKDRHLAIEIV